MQEETKGIDVEEEEEAAPDASSISFESIETAIDWVHQLHQLQNDLLHLDDSSKESGAVSGSKIVKIDEIQRRSVTTGLHEEGLEIGAIDHLNFIYDNMRPRVSTSVMKLKEGFINSKYASIFKDAQIKAPRSRNLLARGRSRSSAMTLGVNLDEVEETLQDAMRGAINCFQANLMSSKDRMDNIIGKVMSHIKSLSKIERMLDHHTPTAAVRKEKLNRFQRRLVEIGIRAAAIQVFEEIRDPVGSAGDATRKKNFAKITKVLPDFEDQINVSIRRLQCELLLSELGEKSDLPSWTRNFFHLHSDTSTQQLVSDCIDQGFWPRLVHKLNGLSTYDISVEDGQRSSTGGRNRTLSFAPEKKRRKSRFEEQQKEIRQKRATLNLASAGRIQSSLQENAVFGLLTPDPKLTPMFVYSAKRYWLLYKDFKSNPKTLQEAINNFNLVTFKKTANRAHTRIHRAVVEALGNEGIGLGRNEANYQLAIISPFVRNMTDYVNELQLRLLFDEVKPALGEAISTFYHRMMKGDDGKVDTPFSNVILNENERAERRMVVKQLREQKNHLQKLTTLMSMLDVASTVQEWKIAEEANDKLILADLLEWTNMDTIIRTHKPPDRRLCNEISWKFRYVGLQSLDEAQHSLRRCPDPKYHSMLQKSDRGNSKWVTFLCKEMNPAERYLPSEIRRKLAKGIHLNTDEKKKMAEELEREHNLFEFLCMFIPIFFMALWDALWQMTKYCGAMIGLGRFDDFRFYTKQHDKFKDPILGIVLNVLDQDDDTLNTDEKLKPESLDASGEQIVVWPRTQDYQDEATMIFASSCQMQEASEALTQYLIMPYRTMLKNRQSLLSKCKTLDPQVDIPTNFFEDIDQQLSKIRPRKEETRYSQTHERELGKEVYLLRHAQSDELNISVDKFETFSKQVGKTKALQVEIESGGKQLVVPCRLKIIFKTLRNLDVETMNLDAELTILTWIGLDGLDRKNPDQARQLKMINWQVGCHPKETPFPKLESGETDPDYLGLPTGGLKFRVNEKEYHMSRFSPNVVMPKPKAEEQTVAITCRGTFSFNFFDRDQTLREMENYPFDVTPVMLKYELTSFQVTPPKEQKRNPFKVRMNVYNLRTTHGSDGRVDSIAKLVSYKSTADKLPEYDIDLSHTCVWFESENKLVERTGKYIKYYPTMVVQIRLFRDPGFALLAMVLPLLTLSFITILFLYVDGVIFYAEKVNNLSTQMLATFTYLLFVRTRLPPISKLTNIDVLIAGTMFMVIVVIIQTCWEGAFFVRRKRPGGSLDDEMSLGDLDDEVYDALPNTECGELYWLLALLVCGQSHDWHQNGEATDEFFQDVYADRRIPDASRPFLLLVAGTWTLMVVTIWYKAYYFYAYQKPRYHLELEMARTINWKRFFEQFFGGEFNYREVRRPTSTYHSLMDAWDSLPLLSF